MSEGCVGFLNRAWQVRILPGAPKWSCSNRPSIAQIGGRFCCVAASVRPSRTPGDVPVSREIVLTAKTAPCDVP